MLTIVDRRLCYQPHKRQVMTATHSYVLGVIDTDSGEAERYASFIKDVFGDLDTVLKKGSGIELGEFVFSFINTMTNRCGTNACVDDLFVKWRDELAPMCFDKCIVRTDCVRLSRCPSLCHITVSWCNSTTKHITTLEGF